MKNVFKQIKQYISDHKGYFIRCTFNAVIVGVIIGIVCAIVSVPASAEASSTIIEAGTYRWNDTLSSFDSPANNTYNISCTLTAPFSIGTGDNNQPVIVPDSVTVVLSGIKIQQVIDEDYVDGFALTVNYAGEPSSLPLYVNQPRSDGVIPWWNAYYYTMFSYVGNITNIDLLKGYGKTITITEDFIPSSAGDEHFATWFNANTTAIGGDTPGEPTTSTIAAGTYFGVEVPSSASFNVPFSFTSDSYEFDTFYVGSDFITYRMLTGDVRSVNAFNFTSDLWSINYETITVPTDQTLPSDFVTWFNANYSTQVTPDPEPTYIIEAGYYKARDSFSSSGWNVSNDSIRIRFYNDAANVQAYEVVDGITFLFHNDAAEIYYADKSVFTDGWNINGAKNIQVLQNITVSSDFYTVFNSVYTPSSEASNEFDSGYAAGYVDGRNDGYDSGYNQGYAQGLADGDQNIFTDIIGGTLGALDGFTIIAGFSLLDLISTLLGGLALVWILKLLAGG